MKIDGLKLAKDIENNLKIKLNSLSKKKIGFLIFESNSIIESFVSKKIKVGLNIGLDCQSINFDKNIYGEINNNNALLFLDDILKSKEKYDGLIIQLPLPKNLDTDLILNKIPPSLDVDLLNQESIYEYLNNLTLKVPPVARALDEILKFIKIDLKDKNILIIGDGKLVGQAVKNYFLKNKINFDLITEKTEENFYKSKIKEADIIITGVGIPHLIKKEMIKDDVIIIDAGTSEQLGKIAGDVDPECYEKCSFFSPVPGGIGPLTVISLFKNIL